MGFVSNFEFIRPRYPALADLGALAERYFTDDPNTCIIKLRQLIERLAKEIVRTERVFTSKDDKLLDLLNRLYDDGRLEKYPYGLFHQIRRAGNDAVHGSYNQHQEAAEQLRNARNLLVWFAGQYGDPDVKVGAFQLPPPPQDATDALKAAMAHQEHLAARLEASQEERERYRALVEAQALRLAAPQVVIRDSLLERYGALPEAKKSALKPRLLAFQQDPRAFDLASFGSAVDDKLAWAALDDEHAMVVARSPEGDVLLCLWIGPLAQAPRWAEFKRVDVHPELGVLQVYDVTPTLSAPASGAFLSAIGDEDLLRCGVPPILLPAVRALQDAGGLPKLAAFLPSSVADALYALVGGSTVEQVRQEAGLSTPRERVDTDDFGAALGHAATQQHFVAVETAASFEAMLEAPMEKWRIFLHPSQQRLVRARANGPMRVLGGAGTGKTVALLHRALYLLREIFPEPGQRLLLTTYTSNLARDLQAQLAKLTTPAEAARVDVVHLHKWAYDLLRDKGARFRILQDRERRDLMQQAIDEQAGPEPLPRAFYLEEWERVVQAQGIADKAGYWQANRRGRGTALSRRQRTQIWAVFERYRALLGERRALEWPDAVRQARERLAQDPGSSGYKAVLADEIQDFSAEELRLLRAIVPEAPYDLFLVGDAHQRIYSLGTNLGSCGIAIRGRSHRLRINYRTTERIRALAVSVLAGLDFDDLDEGSDTLQGYRSLREGTEPAYHLASTSQEELDWIVAQVRRWQAQGRPEDICVAARTGWALGRYEEALKSAGIGAARIQSESVEEVGPGVRVATMHRLKGTEFKRVLLCGVHDGFVPLKLGAASYGDEGSEEDYLKQERCLFYVAATRARDELAICGHGKASIFLGGQ